MMTAINETHNHSHDGIWHRTTHALGKFFAKVVALPAAPTRQKASWSDYYMFPPF